MPPTSQAGATFEKSIQDAEVLLEHFSSLPQNQHQRLEVLKRAGLVMALTAWETYVEDRVREEVERKWGSEYQKATLNVVRPPAAAVASPLILAVSPGVQQAMDAMVSAMLPLVALAVFMAFLSLVLMLLLRRLGRGSWQGPLKGWLGEAMTRWFVLDRLDPREYRVFHDLYVPWADGVGTSQIDHVVVSRFGVFVIETKNLGGWIAGQEKEAQWTQKNGRQTRRIQNPLAQNRAHVKALREFLDFDGSAFIPVVWMIGDARMKEPVPAGVLTSGLKGFLRGHERVLLAPEAVETAVARLAALEHSTDRKRAKREHVAAIQMRRAGA